MSVVFPTCGNRKAVQHENNTRGIRRFPFHPPMRDGSLWPRHFRVRAKSRAAAYPRSDRPRRCGAKAKHPFHPMRRSAPVRAGLLRIVECPHAKHRSARGRWRAFREHFLHDVALLTEPRVDPHGALRARARARDNFTELPTNLTHWPQRLREEGYATAYMGKWHMGEENDRPRHTPSHPVTPRHTPSHPVTP